MRRLALLIVLWALACSGWAPQPDGLRPESTLERGCYDWPKRRINRKNHASVGVFLSAGDAAVDFTLRTPEGKPVHLAKLLQTKPVLLLSGSYTCFVFQGKKADLLKTAELYGEEVHVVVVYTMEGHPEAPNPSIYFGRPRPREYSDRPDATTWERRASNARDLDLSDDITLLVDDLDGRRSNPFWCTYGTCPNCSYLVAQDGTLEAVHEWHDRDTMEQSIDALIRRTRK